VGAAVAAVGRECFSNLAIYFSCTPEECEKSVLLTKPFEYIMDGHYLGFRGKIDIVKPTSKFDILLLGNEQ